MKTVVCVQVATHDIIPGKGQGFRRYNVLNRNVCFEGRKDKVIIVELDSEGDSRKVATVMEDGKWRVKVYGKDVSNNEVLQHHPSI